MRWTRERLQAERGQIKQWGKSRIWALPAPDGWRYGWSCWCDEGWSCATWDAAKEDLEWHIWTGFHK